MSKMPRSLEAERGVLGSITLNNETMRQVVASGLKGRGFQIQVRLNTQQATHPWRS